MTDFKKRVRLKECPGTARFFGLRVFLFVLICSVVPAGNISQAAQEERLTLESAIGQSAAEPFSGSGVMSEEQWMMLIYQKGKESYARGDYTGARTEWDKLNGVVDRYPAFKTVIDYLRGRQKSISTDATDQVDRQLTQRKELVEDAFEKGKAFYDRGQMEEALAAWDKLAAYLPDDAPQR